jgi:sulfate permease, SulP family
MAHRAHLFSLRLAHALQEACFTEKYTRARLIKDILAGITIGVIAVPLAMALAIASGVPPQFGLYTAIVAGFLIAVFGGSRFSISGPTAAFVVILQPAAQTYGLSGLLIATVMAGCLMVAMALMRIGRFIEYIPEAVTLGFTGGIAVVIAVLQLQDFLGLPDTRMPEHFVEKVGVLASSFNRTHVPSLAVALVTVTTMLVWPMLKTPVPPHLPAVLLGSSLAFFLLQQELPVATIGSRFSYLRIDGSIAAGIPSDLPSFEWPWSRPGPGDTQVDLSWNLIVQLFPTALAIALLGAIESLLCAVILDGMSGKRHSANSELFGQGLGNIIAPFFGGITATAALARSAANYRAGAESPLSGAIHAAVVLASMVLLAPLLAYLPMPAMAGLLVVVAWNMSELPKSIHLIKTASRPDILVLITCFSLTVLFDMVIAITVGVLLSAVLFMNEIARLTTLTEITSNENIAHFKVLPGWRVYKVKGPLFFAAADKIFSELSLKSTDSLGVILDLDAVPLLDAGGTAAIAKLLETYKIRETSLVVTGLQSQPQTTLVRAHLLDQGNLRSRATLNEALEELSRA